MSVPLHALEVLRMVTEESGPVSAGEISATLGIPRSTAYRVANALEEAGWLIGQGAPKSYTASLTVAAMGIRALGQAAAREVLVEIALDLTRTIGRLSIISFYDRGHVVYTDAFYPVGPRVQTVARGKRVPALCTAPGKILVAEQPQDEIERVLAAGVPALTPNTKTTREELEHEIARARTLGYGYADGELALGAAGVAMIVRDADGQPAGALSVGAASPYPASYPEDSIEPLRQACERASAELGYRGLMVGIA